MSKRKPKKPPTITCKICGCRHVPRPDGEPWRDCSMCGQPLASQLKYHNQPTTVDGQWFQSRHEANRYAQLKLLLQAGQITDLETQVSFAIVINGQHICNYVADFAYVINGQRVVEDAKSQATRTAVYKIKKKLLQAVEKIIITEI